MDFVEKHAPKVRYGKTLVFVCTYSQIYFYNNEFCVGSEGSNVSTYKCVHESATVGYFKVLPVTESAQ